MIKNIFLFLTSGRNMVDFDKASHLAGKQLEKADAASIRTHTGFAIDGASLFGHITQPRIFMDQDILGFDLIWAAAGTPHHIFSITPAALQTALNPIVAAFAQN